jgi:8-oxo-dGTP pyrophosphatase MutT (NUDIX family)
MSIAEATALLQAFDPDGNERARESVERMMRLLRGAAVPFDRDHYDPGHVTASAVVFTPELDRVLLIYHERLARWLQPGGHIETRDVTLAAAAQREVREETGLEVVLDGTPRLLGIDVHKIPATHDEPAHLHHDFMFCFTAADTMITGGDSHAKWCTVDQLREYGADDPLLRAVERALRSSGH